MKKIICLLMSAAISVSSAVTVFASDTEPSIKVDGRKIVFREEQSPVIRNDRLYVPVRRVLEEMGAKVEWNDENKTVTINSKDNITRLILTINSPEITAYTFTSVFHADESKIESDVAPVIINDRTMLPIRVIAEALGSTVVWDENTMLTTITTKQAKSDAKLAGAENTEDEDFSLENFSKENLPKLSISCDNNEIKKGDTITINLKLADIEKFSEDARVTSVTLGLLYDKENFKYEGYKCFADGNEIETQMSASNPDFYEGCLKLISLNLPANSYVPGEDGVIMHINFTALSDNGGSFAISDGKTSLGYDTELLLVTGEDTLNNISSYDKLFIDTTPIDVK